MSALGPLCTRNQICAACGIQDCRGSNRVRFRFLSVGLFQEKTQQNQNRIVALVPRGGVKILRIVNTLACPTVAKRPIEFHYVFLKLSHRFWCAVAR